MNVSSNTSLQDITNKHFDLLLESGFTKSPMLLKLEDRPSMVHAITLQHSLLYCKAEVDQFMEGLAACGVLEAIRKYPGILRSFYSNITKKLTSGVLL